MGLLDLKMAQRVIFVFFVFVFGDTEDVSLQNFPFPPKHERPDFDHQHHNIT